MLLRCADGGRAGDLLSAGLRDAAVRDPRERGLATELTYGVLRWQRRLDHAIAPHVTRGLATIEPAALVFLRIGAYQLLRLDRIPGPIAVSATQDAAREMGMGRLTGLLNGVLRKVFETGERLPEGDDDAAIGVRASLPDWIVGELRKVVGDDAAEAEALALRERAQTTVRASAARGGGDALKAGMESQGFSAAPGPHGTFVIEGPGDPFATDAFFNGLFLPQDPASLHVVDLLDMQPGQRVLDLCAGRGVKATAIADRGAEVLAVDVDGRKLARARKLATRLGVAELIETRRADAGDPALDLGASFDRVLVDAPCTGLGTLRHHPEIAWRCEPADVSTLADLQARLLATGARHLAPGGRLVYAVCTFTEAEGAPPTPDGLVLEGEPLRVRPTSGMDAFQVLVFTRPA